MKALLAKGEIAEIRREDQNPNNIYVISESRYPWKLIDALDSSKASTGRPPISSRVAFAVLVIRATEHMPSFKNTVAMISDSFSMQFFCGFKTFSTAPRFAASSISNFYARFTAEDIQNVNELMTKGRIPSAWYRINEAGERVCKDDECEYYIKLSEAYLLEHPELAKLSEADQDTSAADNTDSTSTAEQVTVLDAAQVANSAVLSSKTNPGAGVDSVSRYDEKLWYYGNLLDPDNDNVAGENTPVNPDVVVVERKEDSEDAIPCGEANSASESEEMNSDSSVQDVQYESTSLSAIVEDSTNENASNSDSGDSSDSAPADDTPNHAEGTPTACNVEMFFKTEHADQVLLTPAPMNEASHTRAPPHLRPALDPDIRGPTEDYSDDGQIIFRQHPPREESHQIIDVSQSNSPGLTDLLCDPPANLADFVQNMASNLINQPLFAPKSVVKPPGAFYLNTSDLPPLCLSTFANDTTVLPFLALMGKQNNEILSLQVHEFLVEVLFLISTKYNDEKRDQFERRKIMWGIYKISASVAKYLSSSDSRVKKYNYVIEMLNYISYCFRHGPDAIVDATVFPANIKFPTDFELVHDGRVVLENLSYKLLASIIPDDDKVKDVYRAKAGYDPSAAHSEYLAIVKRKKCPKDVKKAAMGNALQYLNYAINCYKGLRSQIPDVKLYKRSEKKVPVIQEIYDQQREMHESGQNKCENRHVSIDQGFVTPIFRGKVPQATEFGLKVHLMESNNFVYDIHHSWKAFNEGTQLVVALEHYIQFNDFLPSGFLGDEIYKNQANSILCRCLGIRFTGKRLKKKCPVPLSDDDKEQTRRDYIMRILIEAIIGTLKTRYELGRLSSITADNQITDVQLAILAKNVRKQVLMGI